MHKSLILLSGGLDSAVCLALYKDTNPMCIGFDYGQPHLIELEFAKKLAKLYGVEFCVETTPTINKVDDVIFAARNAIMVSLAASRAMQEGIPEVVVGCNWSDWVRFPDCRPLFWDSMKDAFWNGYGIKISTPLLHIMKSDIIKLAVKLNIPIDQTWSCYQPIENKSCGKCLACETRNKAMDYINA